MDVHRSRFVPYPVSPITAAAFSRSNDHGLRSGHAQPALKLALGRQDGRVELWNPLRGQWVQEVVYPGKNKSIDGLAWTREPDELDSEGQLILGQHRLFSIAASSDVIEWDLERGEPKRKSTGNFSEVWCFAPQPRQEQKDDQEAQAQDIVAGCDDGTIVLLSTADNDLQFKRFLARVSGKKAKCVSIAYQNRDRVLAGFMDSTIRVFDTRNGSNVRTMSLGTGLPGAPKNAIVWQVRALPNGDIVSGDSNGEVVLWDGRSYTLSQRIKAHDSECLDLVVSADGKTILSGSMNGRLAIFRQTTTAGGRRTWAKNHHRRTHEGQVKAMAAFDSEALSVVVSGGEDLVPVVTPLREYGKEHSRILPTLPQNPPVCSARHARLLVSWWDESISIWRLTRQAQMESDSEKSTPARKLVAKLSLEVKDRIRSVTISNDGRALAAATGSEVKVFQLRRKPVGDGLSIRKLDVPSSLASSGAHLLKFSPDGKWLAAVDLENEIQIVRLTDVSNKPKHIHILKKVVELERRKANGDAQSAFKQHDVSVVQLDFASDSSVLACADHTGHLDSWVLEGHEDITAPAIDVTKHDSTNEDSDDSSDSSDEDDEVCVFYGQHWADNHAGKLLPKLDSAPLVFTFRPALNSSSLVNGNPGIHSTRHNPHAHSHELPKGQHLLWIMTAHHKMYEFDVLQGRLSDWSRRNPSSALPTDFTNLSERVKGAVWDVSARRQRLWLFSSSWLFMLNVGEGDLVAKSSRRKREAGDGEDEQQQQNGSSKRLKAKRASSGAGIKKSAGQRFALPEIIKQYEDGTWADLSMDERPRRAAAGDDEMESEEDDVEQQGEDSQPRLARLGSGPQLEMEHSQQQQQQQPSWWCTYKYRPILGVVPLEDPAAVLAEQEDRPLEVVIVERPLWDVMKEKK